jgi:hypothetical protein
MNFSQIFNLIEGLLWAGIALVLWFRSTKATNSKGLIRLAAAVFFLFGITDWIEIQTGSWHRPWWLFAWNAVCVAALVGCLVVYLRRKREQSPDSG